MFEKDKLLHFLVSEIIVMVVDIALRLVGLGNWAYPIAFVVALGVGVGKELYDRKTTGYDKMDIVADFLGAFAGLVLVFLAGV